MSTTATLTEVSEEEWGTPKDPETKITKEATLRSFTKRGLSRKFAQAIVYRLTPDNLAARINERPVTTRQLLSEDLSAYVPEVTADTVGKVIADMMVDIIRRTAGLVSQDALKQEKQRELCKTRKRRKCDDGCAAAHGAIAISNFDGMCTPVVHVCTCREEKRFVAYYLKMMAYTKVFKAISNGVRQNTSGFRSWDKVGDLLICLPDISEQVAIADELDKLTDATKKGIACFERHIEKLVDLRTRLISDVVTGQIDVRGIEIPDDERAEEFAFPDNTEEESEDIADEEE